MGGNNPVDLGRSFSPGSHTAGGVQNGLLLRSESGNDVRIRHSLDSTCVLDESRIEDIALTPPVVSRTWNIK